jgi:hypothetical protein
MVKIYWLMTLSEVVGVYTEKQAKHLNMLCEYDAEYCSVETGVRVVTTRTHARTHTHTHAHARTRTCTHARTHTHARTRTRTHARAHTHMRARARSSLQMLSYIVQPKAKMSTTLNSSCIRVIY